MVEGKLTPPEQDKNSAPSPLILRGGHATGYLRDVLHSNESTTGSNQALEIELTQDDLRNVFGNLVRTFEPWITATEPKPDQLHHQRPIQDRPKIWDRNVNPEAIELASLAAQEFLTTVTKLKSTLDSLNMVIDRMKYDRAQDKLKSLPTELASFEAEMTRMKLFLESLIEIRAEAMGSDETKSSARSVQERNWFRFSHNAVIPRFANVANAGMELAADLHRTFSPDPKIHSDEDIGLAMTARVELGNLRYPGVVDSRAYINTLFKNFDESRIRILATFNEIHALLSQLDTIEPTS